MNRLVLAPLIGGASLLLAPVAHADLGVDLDPVRSSTAMVSQAVERSCVAQPAPGRRGVWTTSYRAPAEGVVTVRLRGGRRAGDWDLALFDAGTGKLAASSASFAANEVAQARMRRGGRLTVQACRRSGAARRVTLTTQFARLDAATIPKTTGRTQLVKVFTPSPQVIEGLELLGLDVTHDIDGGSATVVLHGDKDLAVLKAVGVRHDVVIADLVAHERAARRAERAYADRVGRSPLPTGRTSYRTYEDYQAEMKALADQFPDKVKAHTLKSKSFQGRDIQVLEITDNASGGDDGRPVFTLGGIHHAREWPAAEGILEFAWDLVKNPSNDPQIAQVMRDVRTFIMPITNPDGFVFSRGAPEINNAATCCLLMGGTVAYKRKNCNPIVVPSGAVPCELALGVDPNRNYATKWGGPGASTNPNDQTFRGQEPFSEPETVAVQELSSMVNSPVHVSTHNAAAKVLRPPGLEEEGFAPDEEALKDLGRRMAEPTGYANEYGWQLYDTTGTTKDWGYDALGQYAYTVEMGPAGGGFHGAYETFVVNQYTMANGGLRQAYINAALYTREESQTSRLKGRAPAGRTLRIAKDFTTSTSPVCAVVDWHPFNVQDPLSYCTAPGEVQEVPEHVEFTMQVPDSGRFTWWMNPSTRPFSLRAGKIEAYKLTCEKDGTAIETREVVIARGETQQLDLPCGGTLAPEEEPAAPSKSSGSGGSAGGAAAGGPATGAPSTVKLAGLKLRGRKASLRLRILGAALRDVRVSLLDTRGRRVGSGRAASLAAGSRTLSIRAKKRLRRGTYRVVLKAVGGVGLRASVRGR